MFLYPCGCPFGVMEFAGETRAEAWREFYDDDSARGFEAMEAGKTLHLMDHDRYAAEMSPKMLAGCPHQGGTG